MDKFVVRRPRAIPPKDTESKSNIVSKQLTIEELQGVVVIEEFERAKVVLERKDTSIELKVDTLQKIGLKKPSKEILIKTKLGKTVHRLCKHEDKNLAKEAKKVYKKWKENLLSKVDRPLIEVKCDLKTTNFRSTARQMLCNALTGTKLHFKPQKSSESDGDSKVEETNSREKNKIVADENNLTKASDLSLFIEQELFKTTSRFINKSYKRTIRKLCFAVKHKDELRNSVLNSEITVEHLITKYIQAND